MKRKSQKKYKRGRPPEKLQKKILRCLEKCEGLWSTNETSYSIMRIIKAHNA